MVVYDPKFITIQLMMPILNYNVQETAMPLKHEFQLWLTLELEPG